MKSLKWLAIFTLLACNVCAQWRSDVWPSDEHWRFTNLSDRVNIKDKSEGYKHTQHITVTSDNSLENFNTNGFTYTTGDASFWENISTPDVYAQHKTYPLFRVASSNITASNSFHSATNEYYSYVLATDATTQALANTWSFYMSAGDANYITNTYNIVTDGVTNGVTEVLYTAYTNVLMTDDYYLDVKELRSMDVWEAIFERALAWDGTSGYVEVDELSDAFPFFYRSVGKDGLWADRQIGERDNLIRFKEFLASTWLDGGVTRGVVDGALLSTNGSLDTWLSSNDARRVENTAMTSSNLFVYTGAPTNYFDYTPYRNLNGAGYALGRVVTNSYIVTGTSAPPALITNNVTDYNGVAKTVAGTNGQTVTLLSTNANIQSGYTELDYGWIYMTNMINHMTYVYDNRASVDRIGIEATGVATSATMADAYATAKTLATTFSNVNGNGYGTIANPDFIPPSSYEVAATRQNTIFNTVITCSSNLPHTVWVYVTGEIYGAGNSVWDVNGYTIVAGVDTQRLCYAITNTSLTNVTASIGDTNSAVLPTWAQTPTNYSTSESRGFDLKYYDGQGQANEEDTSAIIRYNFLFN